MASGFAAEVLLGNVKNLKELATVCAKGFGSTAHQQNEPLNSPIRKAEKDTKHKKATAKLKRQLTAFKKLTVDQLIEDEKKALEKTKLHYLDKIVLMKKGKTNCANLLRDAQLWEIPTDKHIKIKEMMIKEMKRTIEFDCDLTEINKLIEEIDTRISSINPEEIRLKQIESLNNQIDFHIQSKNVHDEHVAQSNLWLEQLMDSFDK